MARRVHPWYRSNRSMWYAYVGGQQKSLNVTDPADEAAACQAFRALLAAGGRTIAPAAAETVTELVDRFLVDVGARVKPRTFKGYSWYLGQFLARFGASAVSSLTTEALEADARRSNWSSSTRNNYLSTIATVLAWGGVKLSRPLRKPPKESAGAATVIHEATYLKMLPLLRGDWRAIVVFLWNTGARPSEASGLRAEFVDWEAGVVRLKDHKTRRSGHGDRLIYLNDEALQVLQEQRLKHSAGLLFVGQRGRQFSPGAFAMKFERLSAKLGVRTVSYGFRHGFATRALAGGESDAIVAALMGHANTTMIHAHYSHLSAMGRQLRDAAARIGKAS